MAAQTHPLESSFANFTVIRPDVIHRLIIPHNGRHVVIPVDEIVHLEGEGNYTYLHTQDNKRYLVSKTLKSYELILSPSHFIRIHKSSIINVHHLKEISLDADRYVTMKCGMEVSIARRKVREVYEALAYMV